MILFFAWFFHRIKGNKKLIDCYSFVRNSCIESKLKGKNKMIKLIKNIALGLSLAFALSVSLTVQAGIITETWTAEISNIEDEDNYFTASVGDSVLFSLTYDDSTHFLTSFGDKLCDSTGMDLYGDCDGNEPDYSLFADLISDDAAAVLSGLVGGINLQFDISEAYVYKSAIETSGFLSEDDFGSFVLLNDGLNGNSYADLYDTNGEYLGGVEFENVVFVSSSVPEPGTLAIFSLGLLGLTLRRGKKTNQ